MFVINVLIILNGGTGRYVNLIHFIFQMLILPATVGLLCFIYGIVSMNSEDNKPSKEICDLKGFLHKFF